MVVLVDSNRAVKISIREWDEENTQYRPDWSADFFEVGSLQQVPDLSDSFEMLDYAIHDAQSDVLKHIDEVPNAAQWDPLNPLQAAGIASDGVTR